MPVSANQTITFDGRLTYSINRWLSRNLRDSFLGHNPWFVMMKEKGNIIEGGLGVQLVEPLMFPQSGGPTAAGITDPWAPLSHVEQNKVTSAYFTPAEYGMPISVANYDMKIQGSETKRVDHVEGVMKVSLKSFFTVLNDDFSAAEGNAGSNGSVRNKLGSYRTYFNRGAGTATPSPATLAEQSGTAVGTSPLTSVGGIDRATNGNAFWSVPCVTDATALSVEVVNNAISLATRNVDTPDIVQIGRKGWDSLVTDLQAVGQANIFDVPSILKKFSTFRYRGCMFFFDDNVPAGSGGGTNVQMFVINSEYIKLVCDTMEPQVELRQTEDRLLKTWIGSWYGQLTSGNLGRTHCRYSNLTI